MDKELIEMKKEAIEAERVMRSRCGMIGNIVAEGCPISQTEVRSSPQRRRTPPRTKRLADLPPWPPPSTQDDNALIRRYHPDGPDAQPELRTDISAHHEVLHRLGAFDLERGTSVCEPSL
jgi:seryl-tRNA synthetase